MFGGQTGDHGRFVIVPDAPDQDRPPAKRGDIGGHIGCSAQHPSIVLDLQDKGRRFGRHPLGAPIDEPVEHDIADHQQRLVLKSLDQINILIFQARSAQHPIEPSKGSAGRGGPPVADAWNQAI